jgi:2-keto-4-pentenoate hydratase
MHPEDAKLDGKALYEARRTGTPVRPLTGQRPGLTVGEAYAIQQEFVQLLLENGDAVVGYKLGLTSKAMQTVLGVDQPDFAPVLASMVVSRDGTVERNQFIQPKIEGEIALVLDRDLRGPGCTALDAAQAVRGAVTAVEIIDSRIEDWKIKLADTIADLASCGAVALGSRCVPVEGFDLRLVGMAVSRNGELVATGAGAAALGSPFHAVAWLANTLADYGVTLEAGHFVMTGSLHAAFPVEAGDAVVVECDRLGSVGLRVV